MEILRNTMIENMYGFYNSISFILYFSGENSITELSCKLSTDQKFHIDCILKFYFYNNSVVVQ